MCYNGCGYEQWRASELRPYPTRQKLPARRGAECATNPAIAYEPLLAPVNYIFSSKFFSALLNVPLCCFKILFNLSSLELLKSGA